MIYFEICFTLSYCNELGQNIIINVSHLHLNSYFDIFDPNNRVSQPKVYSFFKTVKSL